MTLRKQTLMKFALGVALVLAAAFLTVAIRDGLAMRKPENVLPTMNVEYSGSGDAYERLPAYNIRRDSYSWSFLYGATEWIGRDLEVWREVQPGWVPPGAQLGLEFSFEPRAVRVYMAGPGDVFAEQEGTLHAPSEPGEYTYRVQADWSGGRWVVYYFRIRIPVW